MTNRGTRITAGIGLALVSAVALVIVTRVFLTWAGGQRVDETALRGARIGRGQVIESALNVLGLVSVVGLVGATASIAVIAFTRRRFDLAVGAVALVVGSNATTQFLKYRVFERPDVGIETLGHNSSPSGHSTVAASLAIALLLVVPARWRGPTALFGAASAAITGVATLAASWHRPSDVVAAFLVVSAWLGIVTVGLAAWSSRVASRRTSRDDRGGSGRTSRVVALSVLVALAVVALGVGGFALWQTVQLSSIPKTHDELLLAYGGGAAAVTGFASLLVIAAMVLAPEERRTEATPEVSASAPARSR